jgi:serine phosphatase RsbU (regulator of sigma subunit)
VASPAATKKARGKDGKGARRKAKKARDAVAPPSLDHGSRAVALAAARSLWETLPPRRLPVLPSLDLAVRRVAASDPDHIGGDWYDATATTADSVVLDVGDVTGHGPGAMALMAELCHATRAYALLDLAPAQLTSRLADVLRAGGHTSLASVCVARLDLPTGRLTWCNAGHLPPVLITATGDVRFLGDVHGPLLGAGGAVGAGTPYSQSTVTLSYGTTVLLYAAGLVDRPDAPIADRLDALAAAAATAFATQPAADAATPPDAPGSQPGRAGGYSPLPLAAACDALLAELGEAQQTAVGPAERRPIRRDSDCVVLAARLC